eukprot:1236655-Alexandrium_andersonii.AAC.1
MGGAHPPAPNAKAIPRLRVREDRDHVSVPGPCATTGGHERPPPGPRPAGGICRPPCARRPPACA